MACKVELEAFEYLAFLRFLSLVNSSKAFVDCSDIEADAVSCAATARHTAHSSRHTATLSWPEGVELCLAYLRSVSFQSTCPAGVNAEYAG